LQTQLISRSNLAGIETGAVSVTSRVLYDIYNEYRVDVSWLRDGEGKVFVDVSEDEYISSLMTVYWLVTINL
jgi:hypothetical protein